MCWVDRVNSHDTYPFQREWGKFTLAILHRLPPSIHRLGAFCQENFSYLLLSLVLRS